MFGKQKINVGVIGLGIIGSPVAAHLRAAGFAVSVWNRTPKPEPNFLGSPAEVAEAAIMARTQAPAAQAALASLPSPTRSLPRSRLTSPLRWALLPPS